MLSKEGYDTDKHPEYLRVYSDIFRHCRGKQKLVMEIGIASGGSLLMFRDYFYKATIVGVDVVLPTIPARDMYHIELWKVDQTDVIQLGSLAMSKTFDLIIDDGCHHGTAMELSFRTLFPFVRPGGYYIIEDWGVGYMGWDDPPTPFMKSLVDECGAGNKVRHVGFYSGVGRGHMAVIQRREEA